MGQVHSKLSTPPEVVVPWSLTFPLCCHLCACHTIPCHPVIQILFLFLYINIYIHTPSYWFYCNGWKLRKKTLDVIVFRLFMLYLLKGHKTQNTNKHYRYKEVFFPAVFFYAVAKNKGCIFQFLAKLSRWCKTRATPQSLPNTKQQFRLLFLRFYQRFSKIWN